MGDEALKRQIVDYFLSKDILLSSSILERLDSFDSNQLYQLLKSKTNLDSFLVMNNQVADALTADQSLASDWLSFDDSFVLYEKGRITENPSPTPCVQVTTPTGAVRVDFCYKDNIKKREVKDFVSLFNNRYKQIQGILRQRSELTNLTNIGRALTKKDETVSIIGMVTEKSTTQNGHIMLTLEDPTGEIKVLINKNKQDLIHLGTNLVYDEVIGIIGGSGEKIIFANEIYLPDVPLTKELKKSPEEAYALFLSDIHVGSDTFLEEEFMRFIDWINGKVPDNQDIAQKTKYIIIAGDLVDGIGIYPNQDKELVIKDIYDQYAYCAKLLAMIPKHIQIIVSSGNHDAMRIAEPQPILYKDYAKPFHEMENVILVTNPAMVNIHASDGFPGFDVLVYHGYSFDYYLSNVDELRQNGGYDRPDLMMKFLLQRRHLAPTHGSTLYIPDPTQDNLVIDKVPDIFVTGHVHKCSVADYRNVTMICGSCWQSMTSFQEKVGHKPEPARVPIVNLQTREKKILHF